MNISVNVDCTPQELRTYLGLPDVEPMQNAVMGELERRMIEAMEQLSPAYMMKEWFTPSGGMHQGLLNLFQAGRMQPPSDSTPRTD
jgi:hypothetical protein